MSQQASMKTSCQPLHSRHMYTSTLHSGVDLGITAGVDLSTREKRTIIHGIATGVPAHQLSQIEHAKSLVFKPNEPALQEKVTSLIMNTKIEKRHHVLPDFYTELPHMEDQLQAFQIYGSELAVSTAKKALAKCDVNAEDVGKVVFVCSTGIGSLDIEIIEELGIPSNVSRTNVSFMGCSAGFNGLSVVNDFCLSNPGKNAS